MQGVKLDSITLLEKSREAEIVFSAFLGGTILEEIVRRISESEYAESMWLRNGHILDKEYYKRNLTLNLDYDYIVLKPAAESEEKSNGEILAELAEEIKKLFVEESKDNTINFTVSVKAFRKYTQLNVDAHIDDMQVPVSICIHVFKDKKLVPKKETFSLLTFPDKQVSYYSFPTESLLADHYMEIITKLELIQNMKTYYDVYYLLDRESVDGRKVKDYIEEQCTNMKIPKDQKRLAMISGYKNYTYMKKKWKVFLRSIHSDTPDWEMVVERFLKFFEPIWKAVMDDIIFFGDWMPELNRFL